MVANCTQIKILHKAETDSTFYFVQLKFLVFPALWLTTTALIAQKKCELSDFVILTG